MSLLAPITGRRLLFQSVLTAPQTLGARSFGTSSPLLKKSHRSRPTRKSPRNQAIFVALKPELGARAAQIAEQRAAKRKQTLLDPAEGDTVLTLEDACEQLQTLGRRWSSQAIEAHIVTTVNTHETNAFRGRILYPRDPRKKQERILIFAEDGSNVSDAVKQLIKEEMASAPTSDSTLETSETESTSSKPAKKFQPSLLLGGSEMIGDVMSKKVSGFTRILCTSSLLPEVSRTFARSWGPKGLMPSVRRGTVIPADETEAVLAAIAETRGAADWRSDKVGVVRASIGRLSFDKTEVRRNFTTLLDAVIKKVPLLGTQQSTADGGAGTVYVERPPRTAAELKQAASIVKQVHLSSTQGPGLKLDLRDILV